MSKEYYDYYKQNNYKTELKKYFWKKDRNSWILNPENLPPEIEVKGRRENLKNQEFSGILILYPCGFNSDGRTVYVCKCFCGNYFLASGKNVKLGITKSCNCLHRTKLIQRNIDEGGEDIIGKTYGLLTVISFSHFEEKKSGHRAAFYNCKCACGQECIKQGSYIKFGDIKSCGICKNHSIGERLIADFLNSRGINYQHEYSFSDLKTENGFLMRFDFAIFSENNKLLFLLEYDGEQHFKENNGWFKNSLEINQQRDKMKDDYCLTNNLKLIRINYKENLQQRLEEIFNEL